MSDFSIALLGLSSTGKTVVFRLLTGSEPGGSPHPEPTLKPARGTLTVDDPRMHDIAAIIQPAELFRLQVDVTDTPAINEGAAESGTASQETFNALREADVLAQVLRAFPGEGSSGAGDQTDYVRDARLVERELVSADQAVVSREIEKIEHLRPALRQPREGELARLREIVEPLAAGRALRSQQWEPETTALFKQHNLITHRPIFYVVNYGEDEIARFNDPATTERLGQELGAVVGAICGQVEYEMGQLPEAERADFQELYPALHYAASRFPWWAIKALNLVTYFTFGRLGLKEWAVPSGATAFDAARRLHTDIARGLVATEVFTVDDLLQCGSADEVKRQGKLRVEGREHQIRDGEILYFRTSK